MTLGTHRIYYARIFGGEFRERPREEEAPGQEEPGIIRVILIQGLAGTHVTWYPQLEFFSKDPRFDIVALDCRGVGLSDTPTGRWRTTDIAEDVNALVQRELGWDQCHMLGFSLGGMVALEASLHRPDLYKSVTLISTHAGGVLGTVLPPWGIPPFLKTFSALNSPHAMDGGLELLFPVGFLDSDVDKVHDELKEVANKHLRSNDRITNRFKMAWELIKQARKYIEAKDFPEIRPEGTLKQISAALTHHVAWDRLHFLRVSGISFLVMAGMQDNLVNYLNAGMLADALNCPLIMKEDAGHGVNLHYPEEMNSALMAHIERAERKKPVEGRRPLSPRDGFPPGMHPWTTALIALVPAYWLSRRWVASSFKRFVLTATIVSLVLRMKHGPLYRVRSMLEKPAMEVRQ